MIHILEMHMIECIKWIFVIKLAITFLTLFIVFPWLSSYVEEEAIVICNMAIYSSLTP